MLRRYREVLAVAQVRTVLGLGLLIRIPMWASSVALTLHVVGTLGRSYAEAGLLAACSTVAAAISGPWRGRMLDRIGLRRTVAPSVLVQLVCWSIGPFLPYAGLLVAATVAGLFIVPSFSILRQVLIAAVRDERRRTTLALDSALTELTYMIGPALGVWLATTLPTAWVLVGLQATSTAAAFVLWWVDPPIAVARPVGGAERAADAADAEVEADAVAESDEADELAAEGIEVLVPEGALTPRRFTPGRLLARLRPSALGPSWMSLGVVAVLVAASAACLVVVGTEVSIIATLRSQGRTGDVGWLLAVWGAGSLVGGLVYGGLRRSVNVFVLLLLLAGTTLPIAVASARPLFVCLVALTGLLCAPTITATIDSLSRIVPADRRGEVMGWHGSAMTVGSSMGQPLVGVAIDALGWPAGFVVAGGVGLLVALFGGGATALRRRRSRVLGATLDARPVGSVS